MLNSRSNNSFRDSFDKSVSNFGVFVCHKITNFFSFYIEQTNLNPLNDLPTNLSFSFQIYFNFFFYFFYLFCLVFLNPLQFLADVKQKKIFVLWVFG